MSEVRQAEEFGEIEFHELTDIYADGVYCGRTFMLFAPDHGDEGEAMVEGDFTDEERLFIFTQWEMRL